MKQNNIIYSAIVCSILLLSTNISIAQTNTNNTNSNFSSNNILLKLSTPGYETLEKIKKNNRIVLGYSKDSLPFSYVDTNKVYGYSIELCEKTVNKIKQLLNAPNLSISYQEVNNENKFDMLTSGKIDLECGSSNYRDKKYNKINLSVPYYISQNKILTLKNNIIDLNNQVIAINKNKEVDLINDINIQKNISLGHKVINNNDNAMSALNKNQIDGILLDDAIIQGLIAKTQQANNYSVLEESYSINPIGIAMRENDKIKDIVDKEIISLMNSGELNQIYQKWFLKPLAPKGYILNINQSSLLKNVINNPTDIVGF